MVYGKAIQKLKVRIDYPGLKLLGVNPVENPNYLFLDLDIGPNAQAGKVPIQFYNGQSLESTFIFTLNKKENPDRIHGVGPQDLIYLLMPDRFSNGDTANDSRPGMLETGVNRKKMYSRHGGDLQGIIDHLEYLKDLGVTAIWLTPAIENNEPEASYHGYAVTDHYTIDSRFGSNALYKELVQKSHALGIKVIMDLVHNHAGTEGYTIRDRPMKDWVHEWPEYTQTNYQDQTLMDPYASERDRKKMLNGWFDKRMADLNEENPYVQKFLIQNHIWWVEYAGVDGFRLDTYPYNNLHFMSNWASEVRKEYPRLSIFGETNASSINNAFYGEGNILHQGLDTHLPGVTDVSLEWAIYDALLNKNQGVNGIYNTMAKDFMFKDPSQNVVFLDNHDQSRFFSMVGEDFQKYKAGLTLLLTLNRIPQIYYGDEILMKNFSNPDGLVRMDFPGGWKGDSLNKFQSTGRNARENESFEFLKTLANYRKNTPSLYSGKMMQFIPENGIYVFFRYDAKKTLMVIFNGQAKEMSLSTPRFIERTKGFIHAQNILSGDTLNFGESLNIPAMTCWVLELKP